VARLRKQAGIEAQRKRRFRLTVEHHHTSKAAPDLLQRQFSTNAPNRAWVGYMTFIRTRQGWLHLVILLDLCSRKVVGWAMGDRVTTALHQAALTMAVEQRNPDDDWFIIRIEGRYIAHQPIVNSWRKQGYNRA